MSAEVLAAGCALWRPTSAGGLQVALVHRPRYDDWSLPKGKPERGEHLLETAARETEEETGHRPRLGRALGTVHYPVPSGRKTVHWWAAQPAPGGAGFVPGREVDELRWLDPVEARGLLTHPHDRAVLARLVDPGPGTATVLLVRHAHAGERRAWRGDDRLRPLDETGRAQAERLAAVLPAFGVTRLLSADLLRCTQTLEPLAGGLRLPLGIAPAASDAASEHDPAPLVGLLRELALAGEPAVVCSQGGAVPAAVGRLAEEAGLRVRRGRKVPSRKGSTWVLSFRADRLLAADYLPAVEPLG